MPSAKEIAEILGISTSAVSMVLNNRPGISDETRQKVLETAKAIGYQHRSKVEQSTASIQFIVYSRYMPSAIDANVFFDHVVEGISTRAQELNYNLQVTYIREEDLLSSPLFSVTRSNADGAILLAMGTDTIDEFFLKNFPMPLVILDNPCDDYDINSVCINNVQGIQLAVDHLYDLGHRNIAYLGFAGYGSQFSNFSERQFGFIKAVSKYPETAHCVNNILSCVYDENDKLNIKEVLRTLDTMPTAIVCPNDWRASQCIIALRESGYRVPEDVSVIGFDNIPLCEMTTPRLTTISVPKQRMGTLAVSRLAEMISSNPEERVKIEVLTRLIVRDSTAPVSKKS